MEFFLNPTDEDAQDVLTTSSNNVEENRTLIPMRVPVSLLSTLPRESRLLLNHHNNIDGDGRGDQVASSLIINDGGGDRRDCTIEVTDNHGNHTDWYQASLSAAFASTSTISLNSKKRDLQHIGTTNKQLTINEPKPKQSSKKAKAADLKEIGKRTRQLLEEERKKRKEIVRLDDNECLPPLPKNNEQLVTPAAPEKLSKKSKQPSTTTTRKRKRQSAPIPSNIDGWMPSVDHLLPSSEEGAVVAKDEQSNIIRLHGLPLGVKPEHINKFFHGLNPSLIFVLPSLPSYIDGWDATTTINDSDDDMLIKRYASNFRVYVKFSSAPVANAAIERLGEFIGLDKAVDCTAVRSKKSKEIVGVSIAISPVPKHVAMFIEKHMAIHTHKGELIMHTLTKVERQLDIVSQMSWQMAIEKLKLKPQNMSKTNKTSNTPHNLDYLNSTYTPPSNKVQYEKLAKFYNQLIHTQEQLELDCGILFTHTFDPSCMNDPLHRIISSVSHWLLVKISIMGRILTESRKRLEI